MSERRCSVEFCPKPFHAFVDGVAYCGMHRLRVLHHGGPGPVGRLKQLGRPRPKHVGFEHGTPQGYQHHRCRCDACREWRRGYQHEWNARRIAAGDFKHGDVGYNLGCRCDVCRETRSKSVAKRYAADSTAAKMNAARQGEKRRARLAAAKTFEVSDAEWRRLCERYRWCCAYCGQPSKLERDHVIPITRGGDHSIGNLVPACKKCNLSKMDKLLMEWRVGRKRWYRGRRAV